MPKGETSENKWVDRLHPTRVTNESVSKIKGWLTIKNITTIADPFVWPSSSSIIE